MTKDAVPRTTPAPLDDMIEELQQLLPGAFSAGRIDCEKLREALGDAANTGAERYTFTWAGKQDAIRLLQVPSRATLAPCADESIDFDATGHLFIEGDNLEVLKLLYRPYFGRVKMIYIDPPYNTGNDFVYQDDFTDPLGAYLKLTNQADAEGNLLTSNPETSGRYHSTWLSMMYPRLFLARQLLRDDGALFVSIGEQEVHNLRLLLGEIFGEENFVATLVWQKSKRGDAKLVAQTHEYVLIVAKNKTAAIESGPWRIEKPGAKEVLAYYRSLGERLNGNHEAISSAMRDWFSSLPKEDQRTAHRHYRWSDDRGLYFADNFAGPDDGRKSRPRYDIIHPVTGRPCKKPSTGWRWDEERTRRALAMTPPLIHFGPDETTVPCRKTYLADTSSEPFASVFYRDGRAATLELEQLIAPGLLDFPKSADILVKFIDLVCDGDDLVMDFFAGSATTAQAVLELNRADGRTRRFIMVQLPEPTPPDSVARHKGFDTVAEIGKERLRRINTRMRPNTSGQLELQTSHAPEDIGFRVFKLRPSHYRQWAGVAHQDPDTYTGQMEIFNDPLVDGWEQGDVLWEVALKEGFGLSSRVEPLGLTTNHVSRVSDLDARRQLLVCLDDVLAPETVEALAMSNDDLFICRDVALTDELAANLALQCRLKTI